jgi:hypothetical protein
VADNFFAVFGAPVLAGRGFHAGDLAADARVVVVNRSFVRDVLGGRNPVGRRVRYSAGQEVPGDGPPGGRPPVPRPGPWYEIVGVVPDLGVKADGDPRRAAGMYHPAAPDADELTHLAVHVRGDAAAFAQRLRALAAAADPALRLDAVLPMDEAQVADLRTLGYVVRLLVAAGVFALLLSLAGLYAVTSFTVARRTREIGVRVALGADAGWLTAALVRRPLTQVAAGVVLGCGVLAILGHAGSEFLAGLSTRDALPVAAYAAVLVATCGLACLVPARRALAVQPTEALRQGRVTRAEVEAGEHGERPPGAAARVTAAGTAPAAPPCRGPPGAPGGPPPSRPSARRRRGCWTAPRPRGRGPGTRARPPGGPRWSR